MKLTPEKPEGWGYCRWKLRDPSFNRFWWTDKRTDGQNCHGICAL